MRIAARLLADRRAASAAEFAMVLPLFLLLFFGLIDAGRFMWEYNRAEKATQMGVRYAVVTDPVATGVADYSFTIQGGIPAGDPVPASAFQSTTCDDSGCTCVGGGGFCSANAHDPTAFQNIVDRVAQFHPAVAASNVVVEYRNVGLGYAGNPNGPDIAAMVTLSLQDMAFEPLTFRLFGGTIDMPGFRAALTLEDGSGSVSN